VFLRPTVRDPVASGTAKWVYRYTSQDVSPWNQRFGGSLPEESPFAVREALAGRHARTRARDILAMDVDAHRVAFRGPAMQRKATVVLGNVGTAEDVDVLTHASDNPEPLVREHAAWALERLRTGRRDGD
jgi:epoxyqueuosine reductase